MAATTEGDSISAVTSSKRAQGAIGGVIGGLVGGLVLAVFLLIMNIVNGQDVWVGAKGAALPFLGAERTMQPGFELGPVLLGLLSHFAVSVVWGVLFGVLFYGLGKSTTVLVGALWGIVVWLGMFYVVLPFVGAGQVAREAPVGLAIFEHVLFGVSVALGFLPFQHPRRQSGRPSSLRPRSVTF